MNEDKNIQQDYENNDSKLKRRTVAHAAINLPLDSIFLEVFPVEDIGYTSTDVNDEREIHNESGEDAYGNVYVDEISTSNCIIAEWLPWGTNRHTPPNVRRGEKVMLWQYDNVDKYYWTIMGTEDYLRRLETVVWNFSDTRDESVKKLTADNSYSVIMSTHTKEITIQTAKSDGEEFEYIIKLDVEKSMFVLTDSDLNQITLESKEKRIALRNSDETSIVIDKKNITLTAPETIELNSKKVLVNTKTHEINATTSELKAKSQTIAVSEATLNSQKYNITSSNLGMNASKYNLDGGSIEFLTGTVIARNGVDVTGKLMNNGVNVSSTHTHGGDSGGSTTTPR